MGKWITVRTFTYPHEAHMAKDKLEATGMEVILQNEISAQIYGFESSDLGGIKLQVKEEDAENALYLLNDSGPNKEPLSF